jgi:hypothetical protein
MIRRFLLPGFPLIFFGIVEGLVFLSYQHSDGRFHWFLHFFVGGTVAFGVLAALTYWTGRVIRFPLLWLFLGHMLAMFPDMLFGLLSIPHQSWMDVFLLHISAHFIPGQNWTWYGIFLVSLGSYFAARWTTEARGEVPAAATLQASGMPRQ